MPVLNDKADYLDLAFYLALERVTKIMLEAQNGAHVSAELELPARGLSQRLSNNKRFQRRIQNRSLKR